MRRLAVLLLLVGCAYEAKQGKKTEVEVDQGKATATEQEPTPVAHFNPPTYPNQPLQDRIKKLELKGAKKTWSEDWLKGKFGEDEHLEVETHLGPGNAFEWLLAVGGGVVLLVIGGFAAWKLKPPWLGWLFRLFAPKASAVAQGDSGGPGHQPEPPRAS